MKDNIDTTTTHGCLIFNIFASFAEFERELISERTRAGSGYSKILKLSKSTYYRYMEWVKEHPNKGKRRRVISASNK